MAQTLIYVLRPEPPSDAEFEEICPDGGTKPPCRKLRVGKTFGGAPAPTETYGDLAVVNFPMGSDGSTCGACVSVWMESGCPDGTPDVVCDVAKNPTSIAQNSSEIIYILDGDPPFNWEIIGGHGFMLEHVETGDLGGARVNSQNTLYSSAGSCGTAQVQITDNCQTELICEFSGHDVSFEYDWDNSGDVISAGGSVVIAVKDGVPPYIWDISGSGFSLHTYETFGVQNTVYAESGTCGSGIITVEDACGTQIEGSVRSTIGKWELIETTDNGDEACGPMAGVGIDYHNTWSLICDSGGCNESWKGAYHTYEVFQRTYDEWESCAGLCSCDYWVPNGCESCMTGTVLTCVYARPFTYIGILPCCYRPGVHYECFALYRRTLEKWVCP